MVYMHKCSSLITFAAVRRHCLYIPQSTINCHHWKLLSSVLLIARKLISLDWGSGVLDAELFDLDPYEFNRALNVKHPAVTLQAVSLKVPASFFRISILFAVH